MKWLRTCCWFAALFLFFEGSFNLAQAANKHPAQIRPGFMAGNHNTGTDMYLDVLVPLTGGTNNLFFFNPNIRFDDSDGNEQNIGFGYRILSGGGRYIIGGNAYFDTMESENNNRYKQWGFGAELLSQWIDLRANYYDVFGDTSNKLSGATTTSDYYFSGHSLMATGGFEIEEALDGYDIEVSVLIPMLSEFIETRLAAAYFSYDADYSKDPDGWKTRLDIRPVQAVNLTFECRDDDVRGTDSFVGGYVELPFSVENLLVGKNPFAGANLWSFGKGSRSLETRMTDKVIRDRHIVAVEASEGSGSNVAVVDDAMIFVNQDNTSADGGDGSYENPYASLDSVPADQRYSPGAWVYVFSSDATADTYANTHFTLLDDMVLWGQGYQHPLYGLGGGLNPVLDGGGSEYDRDIVILSDNNEIMGFTIQNGETGIYGSNVENVYIHDNTIRGNGGFNSGVHIDNNWDVADIAGKVLTYRIDNNQILDNTGDGVYLRHVVSGTTTLDSLDISNLFTGNTVRENSYRGLEVITDISTNSDGAAISNVTVANTFTDNIIGGDGFANGSDGIRTESLVYTEANSSPVSGITLTHTFINNESIGNGGSGILDENLRIDTNGADSAITAAALGSYLDGNVLINNDENGYKQESIEVETSAISPVDNVVITADIRNNDFSDNSYHGFLNNQYAVRSYYASTTSNSGLEISFDNNTADNNGYSGIYFDTDGRGGDNTWMHYSITNNDINNNGANSGQYYDYGGLYLYLDPSDGGLIDKTLFLQKNTITNNVGDGVEVYVNGDDSDDFTGDFGGGALGSTGNNTFSGNGGYDINFRGDGSMVIWALENDWTNNTDPEGTILDHDDTISCGDIITGIAPTMNPN